MLPRGARPHQRRARAVQPHDELEILHRHPAGAATAARPGPAGVRLAPGPRLDVDLVLVLDVGTLALDAVELDEVVDRGHAPADPTTRELRRPHPDEDERVDARPKPGASERAVLLQAPARDEKRPRLRLPGAFQKEATLGGGLERSS